AWFLPTQPSGKSFVSISRRFGISFMQLRTTSAVASEDWSFTTRICAISGWCANDSMQAAITASSLRAGTMAVTTCGAEAMTGCFTWDRLGLSLAMFVGAGTGFRLCRNALPYYLMGLLRKMAAWGVVGF